MFKSTARGEQFRSRVGNAATKGSRKGYDLLDAGDNATSVLTADQALLNERAANQVTISRLAAELTRINADVRRESHFKQPAFHRALAERDKVKIELSVVLAKQQEIKRLLAPHPTTLPQHFERVFVDVCRDLLTKAQFDVLKKEAHQRVDAMLATTQKEIVNG